MVKQQTTLFHRNGENNSSIWSCSIRRLPPLNALRSFEAAARLGSFNKAAEELFVTPSAVSHQVKSLEAFLGMPLFRREKRRAFLTPAGERYLGAVEHALDELDVATRRLISMPNVSAVNISVAAAYLTRWLFPRIRDFQDQYPDVELRLSTSLGQVDFDHTDTDMAIYFGHGDWEGAEALFLQKISLLPVCSPSLLEKSKPLKELNDMFQYPLLRVSTRPGEWNLYMDSTGLDRSAMNKSMSFTSTSLALSAAIEGAGIALTDRQLVERELEYGQLVAPFDVEIETENGFYLVHKKGRPLTYSMKAFYEWIVAVKAIEDAKGLT